MNAIDRTTGTILLSLLVLCTVPGSAGAAPLLCFNFSQSGYSAGATVTGSFCGTDADSDGVLNSFNAEVSVYSMAFSGSPLVPQFTHTLSDMGMAGPVGGLVYVLGTQFIGDDQLLAFEGIASGPLTGMPGITTYAYRTGFGPTSVTTAFGFVQDNNFVQQPLDAAFNYAVVTSVPEPMMLLIFGAGLVVSGLVRRRQRFPLHAAIVRAENVCVPIGTYPLSSSKLPL